LLAVLAMSGTGVLLIAAPAFAQTLSVSATSPSPAATYDRGETVTITATVTNAGSPVSGATVTANSPTGATIVLGETTAGTYSATYKVSSTDPVGTWTITISASSGGQSASVQVPVSISDVLAVTFTSPPGLTTFNVGESAAIRSVVTYLDGGAVPSSASVTFTNPSGAAQAMSVDTTDPSGRTWSGSHTITSVDVPAQGFDWPITVSASVGGDAGTATQHVLLFSSLLVATSTYSSNSYTVPEVSFSAGQTVFVKAAVTLHDGTSVSSGTVSLEISGTSVAAAPVATTFSPSLDAWIGSYTILPTDTLGVQTVTVSAADGVGNTGTGAQEIAIQSSTQSLAVSVTGPAAGSVFNRGETATIAASVSLGGSPVSGATVTATTPSGSTVTLTNTSGGTYSGTYTVASTDPVGAWTITIQATYNGQLAAARGSATISNTLKVAASTYSSPSFSAPESSFNAGQTIYVKALVNLQDGTAVTSGAVSFELTGSSIASTPVTMTFSTSLDAWTGSYTVLQSDHNGSQVLAVSASDSHGNAGSGTQTVGINVPVTTTQGLEASITFDPTTHGIVVNAVCGSGCVAPTSVTLTNSTQCHDHGNDWDGILSWVWGNGGEGDGHGHHGSGCNGQDTP
jgi:hypothetical protein